MTLFNPVVDHLFANVSQAPVLCGNALNLLQGCSFNEFQVMGAYCTQYFTPYFQNIRFEYYGIILVCIIMFCESLVYRRNQRISRENKKILAEIRALDPVKAKELDEKNKFLPKFVQLEETKEEPKGELK